VGHRHISSPGWGSWSGQGWEFSTKPPGYLLATKVKAVLLGMTGETVTAHRIQEPELRVGLDRQAGHRDTGM
jgi:hypothetical protein